MPTPIWKTGSVATHFVFEEPGHFPFGLSGSVLYMPKAAELKLNADAAFGCRRVSDRVCVCRIDASPPHGALASGAAPDGTPKAAELGAGVIALFWMASSLPIVNDGPVMVALVRARCELRKRSMPFTAS